jgi:hypothetical protein
MPGGDFLSQETTVLTIAYTLFGIAVKRYDGRRRAGYLVMDILFAIFAIWVVNQ